MILPNRYEYMVAQMFGGIILDLRWCQRGVYVMGRFPSWFPANQDDWPLMTHGSD